MARKLAALVAVLLLAIVASCTRSNAAKGGTPRVVSLSPSTTEAIFAIGAQAALVGRSRYCDYPPEVAKIPEVGGFIDPNFEAIVALRPSLVVGARGPLGTDVTDRLAARGVATYFPPTESFAEIDAMILGLGDRAGRAREAAQLVADLDARVAAITRAVGDRPKRKVLLLFGLEQISAAGPNSFADEMIARAGGTNAVTAGGAYPRLDLERVIALDPDVVLNAAVAEAHGAEQIGKDTPGWRMLRAVKEGNVVAIRDESVLRPGPRIADGLRIVAKAIHPDASIP